MLGLSVLALISTLFGMLMAVASDLPSLDNKAEFEAAENSVLYADGPGCREPGKESCQIAKLTGNLNRILVEQGEVSAHLKNAVIAIEDRRFYSHEGVDYAGIGRALVQDVLKRRAAQGGSTITQQFVKNALSAQGDRSVFQKLREAALSYHLERQWSKERILTQYLNTVYFGQGAYGIEAAVRTYFGDGDEPEEQQDAESGGVQYTPPTLPEEEEDPNRRESLDVAPHEAALLAGMISSPSLYDPIENPVLAAERRNLVLSRMYEQRMLTRDQYEDARAQALPDEDEIDPPDSESEQPYFTSWMTQQLVDEYGAGVVFGGGLRVKTTIDPELQAAAESAVAGRLAGVGPDASLVAIENRTGEVKAMVGGSDFDARPFNLATNGHRQPGSAFKPFILVRALEDGIDPNSVWASQPKKLPFQGKKGPELFDVSNYEDSYLGSASLWSATATSDNSVFAELGMEVGPKRVARLANELGIRTELSTNPAMLLGGLEEGVTPLEMAYAYSTIANDGVRVSNTLAPGDSGPVAIEKVVRGGKAEVEGGEPERVRERVVPAKVAQVTRDMLGLVVSSGTGKAAQVGDEEIWGKTGTTENYGDAWFVGANDDYTVAIWVGYADRRPADGVRARRRPGGRRHLPGRDLRRLHGAGRGAPRGARGRAWEGRGRDGGGRPAGRPDRAHRDPSGRAGGARRGPRGGRAAAGRRRRAGARGPRAGGARAAGANARARPGPRTGTDAPDGWRHGRWRGHRPRLRSRRSPVRRLKRRASGGAAHRRGKRPRDVTAVRVAEAPGQFGGPRDPDALAGRDPRRAGAPLASQHLDRAVDQRAPVEREPDPERLGELAGPRAELALATHPAAGAHLVDAVERLERADQDRRPDALLLRNGVQERMHAVGEVDVGVAGRPEQRPRARREPGEGVAGRLLHVVALGLDDPPGGPAVADHAADQLARDVVHGAGVEGALEPRSGHPSASTWRAWASWSRTRGRAVPPPETFDSSQAPCSNSS